jgi:hypothetical protein
MQDDDEKGDILDWVGILHSLHLIHGDEEMVIFWA